MPAVVAVGASVGVSPLIAEGAAVTLVAATVGAFVAAAFVGALVVLVELLQHVMNINFRYICMILSTFETALLGPF